jgi:hypothetical protein
VQIQECEERLRAAKSRFEQAQIDAQCEFAVFEASNERETESTSSGWQTSNSRGCRARWRICTKGTSKG